MLFTPECGITFATLLLRKRRRDRGLISPLKIPRGGVAVGPGRRKNSGARATSPANSEASRQIFHRWHGIRECADFVPGRRRRRGCNVEGRAPARPRWLRETASREFGPPF